MRFTTDSLYNNRPVTVAMGFDQPLQGFFMTIEPKDDDNPDAMPEHGLIYSNLDDKDIPSPGLSPTLDHFRKRLREMRIDVGDFVDQVAAKTD
jgi:hypothetical protein